jgi:hypothetical protein
MNRNELAWKQRPSAISNDRHGDLMYGVIRGKGRQIYTLAKPHGLGRGVRELPVFLAMWVQRLFVLVHVDCPPCGIPLQNRRKGCVWLCVCDVHMA